MEAAEREGSGNSSGNSGGSEPPPKMIIKASAAEVSSASVSALPVGIWVGMRQEKRNKE